MIETISSYLAGKIMDILPAWIGKRILTPERLANRIKIDLNGHNPFRIYLDSEIPSLEIWFTVSNYNPIPIILDRLLFDLWITQPVLEASVLEHHLIPRTAHAVDVHFSTHSLTAAQKQWIRERMSGKLITEPVTIYSQAFFQTKIGWVHVKQDLQRIDVVVK